MSSFVLADDHPMTLLGTKGFVENMGHKVVETATNGITALNHIVNHRPAIAILDVNMPGMDGLDVLMALQAKGIATRVILLTMHREMGLYQRATELQAWGYVLKDRAEHELRDCIDTVLAGKRYVSPGLLADLLPDTSIATDLLAHLTLSERKIVELIAQQKTTRQIAEMLFISEKTVEGHRTRIIEKLELPKEKNALLMWALSTIGAQ